MKTLLSLCAGAALCILASCSEGPTKQMPYNQGINVIPTPVSLVQNEGSFKLAKTQPSPSLLRKLKQLLNILPPK